MQQTATRSNLKVIASALFDRPASSAPLPPTSNHKSLPSPLDLKRRSAAVVGSEYSNNETFSSRNLRSDSTPVSERDVNKLAGSLCGLEIESPPKRKADSVDGLAAIKMDDDGEEFYDCEDDERSQRSIEPPSKKLNENENVRLVVTNINGKTKLRYWDSADATH